MTLLVQRNSDYLDVSSVPTEGHSETAKVAFLDFEIGISNRDYDRAVQLNLLKTNRFEVRFY
jgi:hypothetical protein